MKKILAAALLAFGFATAAQAAVPQPKILVIDRNAILQFSKVGQDISRQMQALSNKARKDLDNRARALQNEGQALQQQIAILSADQKAAKVRAFEAKQKALQDDAQKREQQIQGGFLQARTAVEKALGPIIQQIVQQRGANILLDKSAVVFATDGSYDVTPDAINRLNQKLSSYKVTLAAAPAPPKK
jgi:outer membrane protein